MLCAIDADFGFHALQEFQSLLRLLGLVALIVLPQDLVGCRIDHHGFYRGRADVESDQELACRDRAACAHAGAGWATLGLERSDLDQLWTLVIVHYILSVSCGEPNRTAERLRRELANYSLDVLAFSAVIQLLVARHRRNRFTRTRDRFQKRVSLSMRSLTCRMNCAAVPATPSRCGT